MKIVKKRLFRIFKKNFPALHATLFQFIYGPRRYKHLYRSIKEIKAERILEIGVWNGKRGKKMIEVAKKYNQNIEYYGFDLFEDLSDIDYKVEMSKMPPPRETVNKRLAETGVKVYLFAGNTLSTLPKAVPNLPTMDFIFIDGGHSNETVRSDWLSVSKLMDKSTIVIFDDYWRNREDGGSKLTVDNIDKSVYRVDIMPEIDKFNNPDFGPLEISFAVVTLL